MQIEAKEMKRADAGVSWEQLLGVKGKLYLNSREDILSS